MKEIISVVIPVYNTSQYIEKCIDSVNNQTYPNIELIVVDDGSNQETKLKLSELSCKIDILIHQENKGQSSARNVGLQKAKGEYVIFIDSDDYVELDFCKKLLTNYTDAHSVITCFANLVSEDNQITVFEPKGGGLNKAVLNNIALGTSLFVKRELLNIGGYDEQMRNGFEDWELLIRVLNSTNKKVFVVPEPLYNYRKGIESTTTKANKIKYDLLKYIYKKMKIYINYILMILLHFYC
ncbi:hypothetical protein AXE80_08465 [Wenyingzhuangia fucanilytica]|uniref:Glycosyltransferase 2-like domain-containing protein n=1 Tax=Wenyingzhuangia fucanilytica TaxID=1790137 RepID=A0A1B1Y6E2_9FLAO|nr:glycosyltransferase [Wenyingzhuangia fucanilytica]ANW96308.1 hypothetical protein AXE80_08465 [Wenyingzhuangia fucanilytica]